MMYTQFQELYFQMVIHILFKVLERIRDRLQPIVGRLRIVCLYKEVLQYCTK